MWVMGLETLTAGTDSRDDGREDSGRASKLQKPPGKDSRIPQDSRIPGFQCNSHPMDAKIDLISRRCLSRSNCANPVNFR